MLNTQVLDNATTVAQFFKYYTTEQILQLSISLPVPGNH
jgi:hypothetical protein